MSDEMSSQDEAKLQAARELMAQHNYAAAKAILETMPGNPQAQNWLETIAQIMPEYGKPKRDDIYGQDEYYGGEPGKIKLAPKPQYYGPPMYEDFTSKAVWTLIAFLGIGFLGRAVGIPFFGWIVALVMNIVYLNQARNTRNTGGEAKGIGCLWALLVVMVLLPCAAVLTVMLAGDSIIETFNQIETAMSTPSR